MTIPSSRTLSFQGKSTESELAFIRVLRLRKTSEVFGLLRKSSDFFGNLRKWSCRVQNSRHCQDKNLTLISQKKLAGILSGIRHRLLKPVFSHLKGHIFLQGALQLLCSSLKVASDQIAGPVFSHYFSWLRNKILHNIYSLLHILHALSWLT